MIAPPGSSFFAMTPPRIPGLTILREWVTASDEAAIMNRFGGAGERVSDTQRNRIDRYGPGVVASGYSQGVVTTECLVVDVIPDELYEPRMRLVCDGYMKEPDAITINWFLTGQGVDRHVDRREAGEVIAVLSLQGDATMEMGRWTPEREVRLFELPRRSLVLMRGEARWQWEHAIMPVVAPRMSVVFRRAAAE